MLYEYFVYAINAVHRVYRAVYFHFPPGPVYINIPYRISMYRILYTLTLRVHNTPNLYVNVIMCENEIYEINEITKSLTFVLKVEGSPCGRTIDTATAWQPSKTTRETERDQFTLHIPISELVYRCTTENG